MWEWRYRSMVINLGHGPAIAANGNAGRLSRWLCRSCVTGFLGCRTKLRILYMLETNLELSGLYRAGRHVAQAWSLRWSAYKLRSRLYCSQFQILEIFVSRFYHGQFWTVCLVWSGSELRTFGNLLCGSRGICFPTPNRNVEFTTDTRRLIHECILLSWQWYCSALVVEPDCGNNMVTCIWSKEFIAMPWVIGDCDTYGSVLIFWLKV